MKILFCLLLVFLFSKENSVEDVFKENESFFRKIVDESFEEVVSHFSSLDWKDHDKKDDAALQWMKTPGSNYQALKGMFAVLNYFVYNLATKMIKTSLSSERVIQLINELMCEHKLFKEADPGFLYYKPVHWYDKSNGFGVFHGRYDAGSAVVSDRDFLFAREIKKIDEKTFMLYGKSVKEDDLQDGFPKDEKCVRGEILIFGWKATQMTEGEVKVEYITQTDPKGFIPALVYNALSVDAAFALNTYLKAIEKMKLEDSNEL